MRSWPFIALVLAIGLGVSACTGGKATSPGASLPAMPSYNEEFRMEFANEVDKICGGEHPKSCIFIQDALKLRAQLRAIQDAN